MAVLIHFPSYLETQSNVDLSSVTVTENVILQGYKAYNKNGTLIIGTIPSKQATLYTPTTKDQTISSGYYLSGVQTIKGDSNLIAGNIKKGVKLFGITGTYESTVYDEYIGETTVTPTTVSQTLDTANKLVKSDIIIEGDNNLISSNIKKDVTIFGVTGTLEEGTGRQKDNIEILHLSDLTSTSAVVTACDGLVEISQDGNLETFTKVAAYAYDTNPMGAYYTNGQGAGIFFATSNKTNRAIFFTTPITITDSKLLLKFVYYVSTWINPTVQVYFVKADTAESAKAKIKAGTIDYNYSFVFANSHNNKSVFYEVDNLPTGRYYVCVNAESATGGNEAILENFYILGI